MGPKITKKLFLLPLDETDRALVEGALSSAYQKAIPHSEVRVRLSGLHNHVKHAEPVEPVRVPSQGPFLVIEGGADA